MSKYDILWEYIRDRDADQLTFDEVEKVCGFPIDHSFLNAKKELEDLGYRIGKISMKEKTIKVIRQWKGGGKYEIETFEVTQGNFVLTITKFQKTVKKVKVRRRQGNLEKHSCIYEFSNLDNYNAFTFFLKTNFSDLYIKFEKYSEFYQFSNKYFLIVDGSWFSEYDTKIFNTTITEFASFKSNSEMLILKLKEDFSSFLDIKKDAI